MYKEFYRYEINSFLRASIFIMIVGNFWFMPLAIIEPFLFTDHLPAYLIAAIPIAYRSAGLVSVLFKRFSILTNNLLLIVLDFMYLGIVIYFYLTGDFNTYIIAGIINGFFSSAIGDQWSNQFRDFVSKKYPKENKDFLDCRTVMNSLSLLVFGLINLIPAKFVSRGEYGVVLIYVTVLGIIGMVAQVIYHRVLIKEINRREN